MTSGNVLMRIYRALSRHFGPQHWWPGDTPFEVIVGAILTQNTAWVNVEKAIRNLAASGLLSVRALTKADGKTVARLIRPAGYFNQKALKIREFTRFLKTEYGGGLARMRRERAPVLRRKLLAVHGIGPETADSILLYAFGKRVFVVDAYTIRVLSRHGLISEKARYEDVQRFLTGNLPKSAKLYNEYHALFVRVGKEFCRKTPRCSSCPLKKGGSPIVEI